MQTPYGVESEESMIKTECKASCCNKENEHYQNSACCTNEKSVNTDDYLDHGESESEIFCKDSEHHSSRENNCCSKEISVVKDDYCVRENTISNNDCQKGQDDCYYSQDEQNKKQITKEFEIGGMDCGSCAKTIEKNVQQLPNISQATVNFSTGKMNVQAEEQSALERIPGVVEKLGYSITINESNITQGELFKIEGMDCSSCAQTIEKHLSQLPEVQQVSVSFVNGSMVIQHTNSVKDIQQELKKLGYQGFLEHVESSKNRQKIDRSTRNLIFSGIDLILGYLLLIFSVNPLIPNSLFALSMMISGWRPARSAFYALKSKSLDMNVLMVSAAVGAGIIGEWVEGALVVFLLAIGNVLQNKAVEKTRRSIQGLMDLTPDTAWIKKDDKFIEMNVANIALGDTLLVKAGERIPLDGIVTKGISTVDQAPITGESIPVSKGQGADVFAGTINQEGTLEINVSRLVGDSTIARIIQMVEEAQATKAPSEAFVDKFAKIYTPIVFVLALGVMVVPPVFFQAGFSEWFYRGLELLVVACPCALVISTPVSIVSAIGNAAKNGVLIKGGIFLEKAGEVTAIAFDKTGTITEGKPEVANIKVFHSSQEKIIQLLSSLENHTTHPIGKSIVSYADQTDIAQLDVSDFKTITGKGIQGRIEDITYFAGSADLFRLEVVADYLSESEKLQASGHTIIFLGTSQKILGLVAVVDKIRETSKTAIQQLRALGIQKTVMLTGDNAGAAEKISRDTGVTEVRAKLLPEEKVEAIDALKQTNVTAMVGDGINDAPALASADLGIAMGGAGTDTAIETADIVLMADNLEKLPYTIDLSKRALKIIKQNILFSLIIKFIALVFIFPGLLSLWIAVLSDSGAAVLVTLNALRLAKSKKKN
ncbi:heavy metal translocating P-type ATPase [Enterococcus faecalis]|uniref:heavy metal translocating P-type ATPase n=1 Tax=Enterococcus faecalis TaxID=1351 RepID=UPI0003544035|nr:heavy metal translocating P-type ATPase [Enterococcus faecalis]EPH72110.1 cadmium-exporting ATPase [Enterococcus faecalis 20-SD-BW-06]EPI03163.1 cadmium-exporting ATPase [Enterococcus faecalis 20-SD-BW-08]